MKYILTSNKGFYIGDISYVLSDEVYHDIWGSQNSYQDGRVQVGNYAFAVDRTAYGDGFYVDSSGKDYSVDAGVIGCVPFELIDMDKLHKNYDPGANPIDILNDFGRFVKGSRAEFKTDDNGIFTITINNQISIIIDTNYEAGYEEYDEEETEEYNKEEDEEYDEEYFEEYNGEETADEQFNEPINDSNIEKVLSQAQENPDVFQIHGTGEINCSGVTVKFIYYANPRKPLDGTYIDIDSTDKGFEKVFKGHLNKYLPEDEICRIILRQLTDYLNKSTNQQPAKESISDEVLSKLDSFDADQGNYPLEGASIYYDSQYLRFYFTGTDSDSAKYEVLSFLRSQGFDLYLSQLYVTKYGSSVTVFLPISSLPKPSDSLTTQPKDTLPLDSNTIIYPDAYGSIPNEQVEHVIVKTHEYTDDFYELFPNLKTAKILAGVETVEGFQKCSKLLKVIIQDGVKSIDRSAFSNCTSLTDITIPNSITSIGAFAFYNCAGLTSITLPDSITSIGDDAFDGCASLTSLNVPDSVKTIGDDVFCDCVSLTNVNIPNSVTSLPMSAFRGCSSLTSIKIPDSVTSIDGFAFSYCNSLTTITIPDRVTSIGNSVFQGCISLTSVTIPNSVKTIGSNLFYNCPNLTDLHFTSTKEEWKRLNFSLNLAHSVKLHCTDGTIKIKK